MISIEVEALANQDEADSALGSIPVGTKPIFPITVAYGFGSILPFEPEVKIEPFGASICQNLLYESSHSPLVILDPGVVVSLTVSVTS